MRVLVCGSRDWEDGQIINLVLRGVDEGGWGAMTCDHIDLVIHGDAPGADAWADYWAKAYGWDVAAYPADWKNLPRWEAGPRRNQQMLDEGKPDIVIAFKDNFNWKLDKGGTEDMVKRAKAAGVPTYVVSRA